MKLIDLAKHQGKTIVITGAEGTGKGLLINDLTASIPATCTISATDINLKFNPWVDCEIVIIDGPFTERAITAVKDMMTQNYINCRTPGKEDKVVPTPQFILCSHTFPHTTDRRFMVINIG